MDVKRSLLAVVADTQQAGFAFANQSGIQSSYLEGAIFDQLLQRQKGSGVSAIQILLDANNQGIPIHFITKSNVDSELPRLSISSAAKADILNFANAGKNIFVPEREVIHQKWQGVGYIAQDPITGAGAYMIDGGLNGGSSGACKTQAMPLVQYLQAIVITAFIIEMALIAIALGPVVVGLAAGSEAIVGFSAIIKALMVAMGVSFLAFPAAASTGNPYECECELKLESDDAECVAIAGPRYGPTGTRICQSSAIQRYAECLRGGVSGIRTPLAGVQTPI
jgi:multisubunit Na+/H+ antiporter MnhC subunit